jgi:hypothetical protein
MTPDQLKLARHALGLPNDQKRSYRNRYFAGVGTDIEERWDDLVNRGLAHRQRQDGGAKTTFFCLSRRGAQMAIDPAESLCPEDFPCPQEREIP